MDTQNLRRLLALLLTLGLVAAACGSSDDAADDETTETTQEETTADTEPEEEAPDEDEAMEEPVDAGSVAYGNAQEFSNYNNGLASSNSVKNGIILTQVLPSAYAFAGPGGALQQTELIDSATVVSADPQVIEYAINPAAVWSDGDPVDCAEFAFTWNVYNGTVKQLDADGNVVTDPEDDTIELNLFEITGDTGYKDIESLECSDDGKTVTATFSTIFADWQSLFSEMMPVHVIEREAGVADAIAAFADDRAGVEAMAEFFNTAWSMNPGELLDESLIPAAGPLKLGSWEAGSSLTLVPNENYYGTMANGEVVVRYIAEEAQAQALANSEINAMDPQPTPDLLAALNQTDGVVVEPGPQFVWEHFDFNFNNEALANRDVREAFALCLPRAQMVSNLIEPLAPGSQILNNRYNQEFEPSYADASGGAYDEVDLVRAQELLDASGVAQPVDIRLGWFDNGGNARRTDQVALTIESCNQIGFNVIDNGADTFFDVELSAGDWDIAMFAWAGSPLKTGSDQIYRTGGGINFGGYGNPDVDALLDQISSELDPVVQADLANQVDAILWEDLVTIPVFSFPGVVAYSDNIDGVVFNPSQNGLTWNASTWQLS